MKSPPDSVAASDGGRPFIGVNGHRVLLQDRVRTEAFQQALDQVVQPGMSVLDLGTGTGILAMLAARAGAERVVGVDIEPVTSLATKLAEANGLSDRVTFIQGDSRTLDFGPEFDLIVSECMGNFFVTDEMQLALRDSKRMLAPGGRYMPSRVDLYLAPVFFPHFNEVAFWAETHYGIDFSPAVDVALHQAYVHLVPERLLMGPPALYAGIDFEDMQQNLDATVTLPIDNSITLHGICGWFDARLSDDVLLTTHPAQPPTHWAQTVFPLEPVRVQKGDELDVHLAIGHAGDLVRRVTWSGRARRGDDVFHEFSHDTDRRR